MQLQGDTISPFSGERKAAWNLVLCGLWHTQGPGERIGSVTVSVQTVQGLLLLPGQRVAAGSIPGAVPGELRAAGKQEESTRRNVEL